MKKLLIAILPMIMLGFAGNAQSYKWGVGIKAGTGASGFTVKHFFDAKSAIDVMLSGDYGGGGALHALYEWHVPVIDEGFSFYYGGGAHIAGWDEGAQVGVDGIVGLEYRIAEAPIALSLDFKPELNLGDRSGLNVNTFSLGVKYVF